MPTRHASSDASLDGLPRVAVMLPLPLGPYDYAVPAGMPTAPGTVVAVPLGARLVLGVIWGEAVGGVAPAKLRSIAEWYEVPPLGETLRRFIERVAAYTMSPPGAVLRMAISVPSALVAPSPTVAYRRGPGDPEGVRMTPARGRVLALAADGMARAAAELAREAGVGTSVVHGLVDAGLLEAVERPGERPPPPPDWRMPAASLSPDQARAADDLARRVAAAEAGAVLLDGVTGSGKTEVYFAAIAAALERGRQALVLVPEIALTGQWLARFSDRFGAPPTAWHSDLTQGERRRAWRAVALGTAKVVVGARSALFLPFADLGLVVVDEEHEAAFKQEDGVSYHARDMAVLRAHMEGVPVVLVSATPSLETVVNVERGRYGHLHLPDRHGAAGLPIVSPIDLRREPPARGRWLSPRLVAEIEQTLAAGEQALLFLNRRGYAPLTLCRGCGHRLQCPSCTAWLVEHRLAGRLLCHHCGFATALPSACPACGAADSFAACGPGVERLAEEVARLFPAARRRIVASDTLTGPRAVEALIEDMRSHAIDILIGTQVVAKGHHFPLLTLVGVVDADLGLAGGDLRAGERTFQLLHQVAGRAGRADRAGTVLLQTTQPEHPVIRALVAGDRDGFLAREADERRAAHMPPFARLVALIVSGPDPGSVDATARALARAAPREEGVRILGPAPAPLAVLRGRHRRRFLVRGPRERALQGLVARWLEAVAVPRDVRVQVDVDPYSFV